MSIKYWTACDSPIGPLTLVSDATALVGLYMEGHDPAPVGSADWIENPDTEPFDLTKRQLREYFAGQRQVFDIPLVFEGTEFQQSVWKLLLEIPFGQTTTYGELATKLGKPGASRAVGLANGQNPISIIVPCHRVVGSSGRLTGYAGGLARKQALLAHEQGFTLG